MELGNAMFGHSRGMYEIDRYRPAERRLMDLMTLMGFDDYGNNVFADGRKTPDWLSLMAADRGARILDADGWPRVITRRYWWGDTESDHDAVQAHLPNLEIRLTDGPVKVPPIGRNTQP